MTTHRTTLDPSIGDGVISIDERQLDLHDVVLHHQRTILNTKDAMVRKGLIAMGWTPPGATGVVAYIRQKDLDNLEANGQATVVLSAACPSEHWLPLMRMAEDVERPAPDSDGFSSVVPNVPGKYLHRHPVYKGKDTVVFVGWVDSKAPLQQGRQRGPYNVNMYVCPINETLHIDRLTPAAWGGMWKKVED